MFRVLSAQKMIVTIMSCPPGTKDALIHSRPYALRWNGKIRTKSPPPSSGIAAAVMVVMVRLALSAVGKYTTYNGSAEAGEMARSVRCLPHMHEDLSSIASTHMQSWLRGWGGRQENPGIGELWATKKPCLLLRRLVFLRMRCKVGLWPSPYYVYTCSHTHMNKHTHTHIIE